MPAADLPPLAAYDDGGRYWLIADPRGSSSAGGIVVRVAPSVEDEPFEQFHLARLCIHREETDRATASLRSWISIGPRS